MDQAIAQLPARGRSITLRSSGPWLAAIGATLLLILTVNPVGFIGGGADDWQYLNAARCWAEQGSCLPQDHWQGRWPVIAPVAAMIALLGEGRLTIGLPSLAYALGCLFLLARLGNAVARPPAGYAAALLLLVMPLFGIELMSPNAEHPELFFLLAAANFVHGYASRKNAWLAFAAGLGWSLAFQVRETAVAALPLLALAAWLFARRDPRALAAAAAGASLPLLAELLIYYSAAGDPLWRRHLSVAHTRIASTELVRPVDPSRSPILNPDYIAGWRQQPGIHLHWTVDGILNLLANFMAGLAMPLSLLFAAIGWGRLDRAERRVVGWSLAAALLWASILIYVLAVDPKPRMMFVPVSLAALALSVLLRRMARSGSAPLAATGLAICWLAGMASILLHPQFWTSEDAAKRWAGRYPQAIETDETTRRHLTLEPAAKDFADLTSNRPLLAVKLPTGCRQWATAHFPTRLGLLASSPLGLFDDIGPAGRGYLCLFRYRAPVTPDEIGRTKLRRFGAEPTLSEERAKPAS